MKYWLAGTYDDFKSLVELFGATSRVVYSKDGQSYVQSIQALLVDGSVIYGVTSDSPLSGGTVVSDFPEAVELDKTPVVKAIVS